MTTTGLVTPKCYAAAYRDCDGGAATREHWITKALQQRIQHDGTGLRVAGLSWFEGERDSHEGELTARMLCARHNHMLHDLDASIVSLHDAWLAAGEEKETHVVIHGDLLERWALKVLVGMVVSGAALVDGVKVKMPAPHVPRAVLDIVFGLHDLPSPRGFYFVIHDERDEALKIKVNTPPLGHELEGVALGITIQFLAFRFLTWLNPVAPGYPHILIHRPAGIDLGSLGRIALQWNQGAANGDVRLDLQIRGTGELP